MKWINPGIAEAFDVRTESTETHINTNSMQTHTGYEIGVYEHQYVLKAVPQLKEGWMSLDCRGSVNNGDDVFRPKLIVAKNKNLTTTYFSVQVEYETKQVTIRDNKNNIIYKSEKSIGTNKSTATNIEVHFKMGEEGRIDIWENTKLLCSYRSPTFFPDVGIDYIGFEGAFGDWHISSIIIQDTRRIGLEKFQKLTIDPDTEQNMPMGSTTTYKLSGLSDATEFSDITSVCAVLQATSRDANITTGTYSIEGADVGTIDVSDSSGKAYEIAHSEINSVTGKPWVRDDIEGKTLSFTVNGAS